MTSIPDDTVATVEDFERSGWREAVAGAQERSYGGVWQSLSDAARQAAVEEDFAKAKVLRLLSDCSSMMLRPESPQEPFGPRWVMDGRRSALPEDLDPEALDLLAGALSSIDDAWLRARLADLLWLRTDPRNPEYARAAIDAYLEVSLDTKTWVRGGRECWDRALRLARTLGSAAGDREKTIHQRLLSTFEGTSAGDDRVALWLAGLMRKHRVCTERAGDISSHLLSIAKELREGGSLHSSRECFDEAYKWCGVSGDRDLAVEATVAVAESWVAEAEAQLASESPRNMLAASHFESAIQAYRRVPRAARAKHSVEDRLAELRARLSEAGERSLDEMGVIESPAIDLTEAVRQARASVRGKPLLEALAALATVARGGDVKGTRDLAEEILKDHPLQGLLSAIHMSQDGRVVAKTSGVGQGGEGSEDYDGAIWRQMIQHYQLGLQIDVQGSILPALRAFLLEHRVRESDLVALASSSPIVPEGRELLMGKALFAGFDFDFATAIHLLSPQIENLVRVHLRAAGVTTTALSGEGIETEVGLSALMDKPEAEQVFGADLAFELRALFCDPRGPNLRNEVAHGLLDDGSSHSMTAFYAWWFGLRLVFIPFYNRLEAATDAGGESEE